MKKQALGLAVLGLWWMAAGRALAAADPAASPIPVTAPPPVEARSKPTVTVAAPVWNAPDGGYARFLVVGGAFHVLIDDLSGDGRLDLAFTSHGGNAIRVYRQTAPRQFVGVDEQDITGFHPNDTIALATTPKRYVFNAEGAGELRTAAVDAEGRFNLLAKRRHAHPLSSTPFDWPDWGTINLAVAPYSGAAITLLRDFNPDTAEVKAELTVPAGKDPRPARLASLKKDGVPALVFPSFWDNKVWAIEYPGPDRDPEARLLASFTEGWPRQVIPFDVNQDGVMDLLVPMSVRERIAVLLNDGRGHFQEGPSLPYPGSDGVHTLATGQDSGGRYLLAGGSGALVLYRERRDASGGFETKRLSILNWPNQVALADVDGDGWLDAVVANQGPLESALIYGPLWEAFGHLAAEISNDAEKDGQSVKPSDRTN